MTRQLRFRPAAIADIEGIWDYSAERWGVEQADRYVLRLRETCLAIAREDLPGQDISLIRPGYRKQLSGRHVVYYRVIEDGAVDVIRILHQRMDVSVHLGGDQT